jgi:hypothetical protein
MERDKDVEYWSVGLMVKRTKSMEGNRNMEWWSNGELERRVNEKE